MKWGALGRQSMERLQQIEEIFQESLQHDPAQRYAYVCQACGGDTELQREVLSLTTTRIRTAFIFLLP